MTIQARAVPVRDPVAPLRSGARAGVVELVDTPALGAGGRKPLGVRVPSPAPAHAGCHLCTWDACADPSFGAVFPRRVPQTHTTEPAFANAPCGGMQRLLRRYRSGPPAAARPTGVLAKPDHLAHAGAGFEPTGGGRSPTIIFGMRPRFERCPLKQLQWPTSRARGRTGLLAVQVDRRWPIVGFGNSMWVRSVPRQGSISDHGPHRNHGEAGLTPACAPSKRASPSLSARACPRDGRQLA